MDYLLEINKTMNLTAVRDPDKAWQRHVGDSLALLPVIDRYVASMLPETDQNSIGGAGAGGGASMQAGPKLRAKKGGQRSGAKGAAGGDGGLGDGPLGWDPLGSGGAEWWGPSSASSSSSSSSTSSASSSSGGSTKSSGGGGSANGDDGGSGRSGGSDGGGARAGLRVIDVGTGAGLPGMVLAIARPQWKVTLLDSLRKRCDFLEAAVEKAGLSNVSVVWSRAEDGGQSAQHRGKYDLAVARAVAETRVLAELCLPFVRVGGLWVAPKGPAPDVEVAAASRALSQLGATLLATELVDSFSADGQRTCIIASKDAPTLAKYPRRAGMPNKEPL
ncbi:hypothetical protein FOA52_000747 [Chlamydomonas sp. UWO 241]|nr:hypothetical protein FOA52_000747 [Chlamydomonas sp. UWO 241]